MSDIDPKPTTSSRQISKGVISGAAVVVTLIGAGIWLASASGGADNGRFEVPSSEPIMSRTVQGVVFDIVEARRSGPDRCVLEFRIQNTTPADIAISVSGSHNASRTRIYTNDKVYSGYIQIDDRNSVDERIPPGLSLRITLTAAKLEGELRQLDVLDLGVSIDGQRETLRFEVVPLDP